MAVFWAVTFPYAIWHKKLKEKVMDLSNQQWGKTLIIIGLAILALGLFLYFFPKISFGKLPGDIAIKKEGFSFYFPITSSILFSLLLSILFWLYRKFTT